MVGEEEIIEAGNIAPIVREARMEVEGENQAHSVVVNFGYRQKAPIIESKEEKKEEVEKPDDKE